MTCERCGTVLVVGAYPFCHGNPADHGRGHGTVVGDEMDHLQTNGPAQPIRFTSKAARKAWLKANGLTEAVRHVPLPGTDKSPHTVNWGSRMDPYTAENVRILLERAFTEGPVRPVQKLNVTLNTRDATPEEIQRYGRG